MWGGVYVTHISLVGRRGRGRMVELVLRLWFVFMAGVILGMLLMKWALKRPRRRRLAQARQIPSADTMEKLFRKGSDV